ncbi:P protein [Nyavirus gerbillisci]|uniref:P protein n=1 Tax=Toure nyavirus TaxID=2994001 RepID=A0A9E8DA99_9MONO|nr:P protein [Toure nyavirus]
MEGLEQTFGPATAAQKIRAIQTEAKEEMNKAKQKREKRKQREEEREEEETRKSKGKKRPPREDAKEKERKKEKERDKQREKEKEERRKVQERARTRGRKEPTLQKEKEKELTEYETNSELSDEGPPEEDPESEEEEETTIKSPPATGEGIQSPSYIPRTPDPYPAEYDEEYQDDSWEMAQPLRSASEYPGWGDQVTLQEISEKLENLTKEIGLLRKSVGDLVTLQQADRIGKHQIVNEMNAIKAQLMTYKTPVAAGTRVPSNQIVKLTGPGASARATAPPATVSVSTAIPSIAPLKF